MKIEIVVDPINMPAQSLASRVAPAPITATTGTTDTPRYGEDPLLPRSQDLIVSSSRGGPRRGRGRGARRRSERPSKSVADLDAEMEVTKLHPPVIFHVFTLLVRTTPLQVARPLPPLTLLPLQLNCLVLLSSLDVATVTV